MIYHYLSRVYFVDFKHPFNGSKHETSRYGLDIKTRNAGITACQKASEGNQALMLFEDSLLDTMEGPKMMGFGKGNGTP